MNNQTIKHLVTEKKGGIKRFLKGAAKFALGVGAAATAGYYLSPRFKGAVKAGKGAYDATSLNKAVDTAIDADIPGLPPSDDPHPVVAGAKAFADKLFPKKKPKEESFIMKEQTDIKHLIKHLGEKNYSEADKYLKQVVEDKLQAKIKDQYKKQKLY